MISFLNKIQHFLYSETDLSVQDMNEKKNTSQ